MHDDDNTAAERQPMLVAPAAGGAAGAAGVSSTDKIDSLGGDSRRAECGTRLRTPTPLTGAMRGLTPTDSSGRRRIKLFERANDKWWNPQFASVQLESCYWKASFPQMRDRFRCGLLYLIMTDVCWAAYHVCATPFTAAYPYHLMALVIVIVALGESSTAPLIAGILCFTFTSRSYQRFYLPTSFLSMFLLCVVSLLVFSLQTTPLIR